jgi:hypothetical protein
MYYINQEIQTISRNFKALPIVFSNTFKLQPEDGSMRAETF